MGQFGEKYSHLKPVQAVVDEYASQQKTVGADLISSVTCNLIYLYGIASIFSRTTVYGHYHDSISHHYS